MATPEFNDVTGELTTVRLYTEVDPYHYTTDNRPLEDLLQNVSQLSAASDAARRAILIESLANTSFQRYFTPGTPSLVGLEVVSVDVSSATLSPGLLLVKLPISTTNPTEVVKKATTIADTAVSLPGPYNSGKEIVHLIQVRYSDFGQGDLYPYEDATNAYLLQVLLNGKIEISVKSTAEVDIGTGVAPTADAGWLPVYSVTYPYGGPFSIAAAAGSPAMPSSYHDQMTSMVSQAETYKNQAGVYATNSYNSSVASAASASAAATSETNADTSEANAAASATNAASSASAAATSATAAATSADTAEFYAIEAEASDVSAASSATSAATSEANALTYRNQAQTARDEAVNAAALVTGSLIEKGGVDLSSGTYPAVPAEPSFWKVTVGGTVGGVVYGVGDTLVYSETLAQFYKIDSTESVSSVNGYTGAVNLSYSDVGALSSTGNAVSASKWQTARNFSVSGAVSGVASMDGSANVNILTSFATPVVTVAKFTLAPSGSGRWVKLGDISGLVDGTKLLFTFSSSEGYNSNDAQTGIIILQLVGGFSADTVDVRVGGMAYSLGPSVGYSQFAIRSPTQGSTTGVFTLFGYQNPYNISSASVQSTGNAAFIQNEAVENPTGYVKTFVTSKIWNEGNDGAGTGLNADLLDDQHGSFYTNASNLSAGTVPYDRLSGSYGINSYTASYLQTPRLINGVSFNGGADISVPAWNAPGSVSELGQYLDLHISGSPYDFDVRLDASATGNGWSGGAQFNISAAHTQVGGSLSTGGLFYTKTCAGTGVGDVNTGDSTISIRGSSTAGALMTFHRAGAYAVNFGLETNNNFTCGGYSDAVPYRFSGSPEGNFVVYGIYYGNGSGLTNLPAGNITGTISAATQGYQQSLGGSGYTRLPNGLIIQWGRTGTVATDSTAWINFPTTFTNVVCSISVSGSSNSGIGGTERYALSTDGGTTTGFTIINDGIGVTVDWVAIGY